MGFENLLMGVPPCQVKKLQWLQQERDEGFFIAL
jgi:hypothetical protein